MARDVRAGRVGRVVSGGVRRAPRALIIRWSFHVRRATPVHVTQPAQRDHQDRGDQHVTHQHPKQVAGLLFLPSVSAEGVLID